MPLPPLLQDRLSLPVIGAPLFIVSVPELVIAQCKAGIVGSFPALNARPKELLEEWLIRIETELADYQAAHPEREVAPFAVNQIVHASNDRLEHDMAICVKHQVPIIITSLRAPPDVVEAAHSYGGIVLHDVINVRHARKAAEEGVDGLILVCAGAGGHAGTLSPVRAAARGAQLVQGHHPAVRRDLQRREHCSPRRRWAPTSPISARASSPRARPMPARTTSRC